MTDDDDVAEAQQWAEIREGHKVQRAFRLGWHFAQMYHDPHRVSGAAGKRPEQLPRHLPAQGELTVSERASLLMLQVANDVRCLDDGLPDDLKIPDVLASVATLDEVMKGQAGTEAKKAQILQAYTSLRVGLGAADPHLGTALDLGRILADTVILPVSPADYHTEFSKYRLAHVYGWLEDLHSYFPRYAADTVKGSLEIWQGWVEQHAKELSAEDRERVKRVLCAQGEKWRRILSGEILAQDFLTADDYRDSATYFLGRLRSLIWDFVKRFWPVGVPIALVTAAVAAAIVIWAPGGPASVVAFIAAAAGSLGVSWKTVSATLGKVATNAEQPLWNAEVQESIVIAATRLPADLDRAAITSLRQSSRAAEARLGKPPAAPPGQPAPGAPAAPPAGVPAPAAPEPPETAPEPPGAGPEFASGTAGQPTPPPGS